MKSKHTFGELYLFLLLVLVSSNLRSQITIGNSEPSAKGALLQLKSFTDVVDGAPNSDRGLGLPRVALIDKFSLEPCTTDDGDTKAQTGLLVYNVTEGIPIPNNACDPSPNWDAALTVGLMVWNGTQWEELTIKNNSTTIPPAWVSDDIKFVKDHENNIYPTRKFGSQGVWMLENLRTVRPENPRNDEPSIVGTSLKYDDYAGKEEELFAYSKFAYSYVSPPDNPAENGLSGYDSPSYNDPTFFKKYPNIGLRYNYNLAFNCPVNILGGELDLYTDPSETNIMRVKKDATGKHTKYIQGICPEGWHVPYDSEFRDLIAYISTEAATDPESVGINPNLKSGVAPMRYPLVTCLPGHNLSDNRGASHIALKGGLALTWSGGNSIVGKQKEYGGLAGYIVISEFVERNPTSPGISKILNKSFATVCPIRPHYNSWSSDKAVPSNQFSVRCKKNDDNMDDLLDYNDIIK